MRLILLALISVLAALPAWAQTEKEIELCNDPAADEGEIIAGCTAMIQSGRYSGRELARAYVLRGAAHMPTYASGMRGDIDRAIADQTKAIELDSRNALGYYYRGISYRSKALYDQALADLTRAIALKPSEPQRVGDPANYDYFRSRGETYTDKGLYDPAIADLDKAIATEPRFSGSYVSRARAYHLKGDDARALADAEKAVSLQPRDPACLEIRAEIYEKLGQRDRAIADYRAVQSWDRKHKASQDGLRRLGVLQ